MAKDKKFEAWVEEDLKRREELGKRLRKAGAVKGKRIPPQPLNKDGSLKQADDAKKE